MLKIHTVILRATTKKLMQRYVARKPTEQLKCNANNI